jgi:hypothetical protein
VLVGVVALLVFARRVGLAGDVAAELKAQGAGLRAQGSAGQTAQSTRDD